MTGPTIGVRSSELRPNASSSLLCASESLEDEPWDQRRPSANDTNISSNKAETMRVKGGEEDESLDDGDLPSLSAKLSAKSSGNIRNLTQVPRPGGRVDGEKRTAVAEKRTTTRPSNPSGDKGLKMLPPNQGRRKFWGQLEDSEGGGPSYDDDDDDDDEELSEEDERDNRPSSQHGNSSGRKYAEEDGPDDEMAARRADRRSGRPRQQPQPRKDRSHKDYDTDYAAPTDNESELTEWEEEEEPYATTFCGQTLNALGDMCGGRLNLTGSGTDEGKERKRSATKSPPVEENRRSSASPSRGGSNQSPISQKSPRANRSPPQPLLGDAQQEHTAIEVEFIPPVKGALSAESSQGGGAKDAQKKNGYLNAMAKKAKENFQSKKSKHRTQQQALQPNNAETKTVQRPLPREIESPVVVDVEESATAVLRSASAEGSPDDDYNSFNATEKRKFIKLINSGVIAGDAARQIIDDRKILSQAKEQRPPEASLKKVLDDSEEEARSKELVAARLAFWQLHHEELRSQSAGAVVEEGDEVVQSSSLDAAANVVPIVDEVTSRDLAPEVKPADPSFQLAETVVENNRSTLDGVQSETEGASVSDADSVPFEKSGSHYYDAVRREVDEESMGKDGSPRGKGSSRGRELARAQRFFGALKSKGFAALPDSPEKRAASAPRQRLAAVEEQSTFASHRQQDEASESRRIFGGSEVESTIAGTLAVSKAMSSLQEESLAIKELSSSGSSVNSLFRTRDVEPASDINLQEFGPEVIRPTASTDDKEHTSHPETDRDEGAVSPLTNSRPRADSASSLPRSPGNTTDEVVPDPAKQQAPIPSPSSTFESKNTSVQAAYPESALPRANEQGRGSSMDDSMEMYFSSTADVYSVSAASRQHDNMSVYTSGTSVTGATSYTQSSRVRRPGVAKARLAKQKQIEQVTAKKAQGWHETIRAAAESTNRTWDPKHGWVDYEEPDAVPAGPLPSEKGKIRVDLDRSVISHKEIDSRRDESVSSSPAVPVPFPREWEKEREAMIHTPVKVSEASSRQQDSYSIDQKPTANMKEIKPELTVAGVTESTREAQLPEEMSTGGSTPKGWIESMRAASASLAKAGKVWDPEHGWTNVDRNSSDVLDLVDFNDPNSREESLVKREASATVSGLEMKSVERHDPDVPNTVDFNAPTSLEERLWKRESSAAASVIETPSIESKGPDTPDIVDFEGLTSPGESIWKRESSAAVGAITTTSVHSKGPDAPVIVDFDVPTFPDERALKSEWPTVVVIDTPHEEASLPKRSPRESSEESRPRAPLPLPPEDASKKLNRWIAKKTRLAPRSRSELSTESSDRAVASGGASSRINLDEQLGAFAAMRQHDEFRESEVKRSIVPSAADGNLPMFSQNEPSRDEDPVDDSAPLIDQLGMFPSLDDRNIVDVVKKRVDEDDMDLFPRDDPKALRGGRRQVSAAASDNESPHSNLDDRNLSDEGRVRVVAVSKTARSNASILSKDPSSTSSRRGGGPIDVDDVDETWESDDEDRHSSDWLPDGHRLDRGGGSGLSNSLPIDRQRVHDGEDEHQHIKGWKENGLVTMANDARSVSTESYEARRTNGDWAADRSPASPSKKVPKLRRSKRDTSPLSVRKLSDGGLLGADEHQLDGSRPEASNQRESSPFRTNNVDNEQSLSPVSGRGSETSSLREPSPFRDRDVAKEQSFSPGSGRRLPVAAFRTNIGHDNDERDAFADDSGRNRSERAIRSNRAVPDKILKEVLSPDSPSVKARLQEWETRIETSYSTDAGESVERNRRQPKEAQVPAGIAGWRSFLGKKVQAESAAAAAVQQPKPRSGMQERKEPDGDYNSPIQRTRGGVADFSFSGGKPSEEDSLFEFVDDRRPSRNSSAALDMSDMSAIQAKDEVSDIDDAPSEAYGPTEDERRSSSFLQRLTECAAPMMPNKQNHGDSTASPSGHLAFFRSNSGSAKFVPTSLCGGQGNVDDPDSVAALSHDSTNSAEMHRRSMSFGDEKPRSMSSSRDKSKPETVRVSSSSVVSEDFGGVKTAYLESVAMKAAVSKPRRSISSTRRREPSAGSSVASGSTDHSEKWKAFLERKRASGPSPGKSRTSGSDISTAAEQYAAEKVEEIMTKMASRSKAVSRSRDSHKEVNDMMGRSREVSGSESMRPREKTASLTAAEDLAAARVEAMMAALSTSHIDEGEI